MICKLCQYPNICKKTVSTHSFHTRIANKKNYGELMQRSDSGGSAGGSPHGSESSAVDSDYSSIASSE